MRRSVAALLCPLLLLLAAARTPPHPRVKSLTVTTHVTAAAVWVVYSVSTTANPDSVRVTVTGPTTVTKTFTGASKKDSVSYARPAQGATIGGTVTPTPYKAGNAYPAGTARPWSYSEPVVPPTATVDSVRILPTSGTGAPGATQRFTAIVYTS